jgi:hypothetical protein
VQADTSAFGAGAELIHSLLAAGASGCADGEFECALEFNTSQYHVSLCDLVHG